MTRIDDPALEAAANFVNHRFRVRAPGSAQDSSGAIAAEVNVNGRSLL